LPISYNIAPNQEVLAIRLNPETKQRSLDRLRWGLVPSWAKDEKIGFKTINARAETVDAVHSFRSAFSAAIALSFHWWYGCSFSLLHPYLTNWSQLRESKHAFDPTGDCSTRIQLGSFWD
jgi:hypothetical protein